MYAVPPWDRRRAALRDLLVSAAMRSTQGRRYLTEMRYRPTTRFQSGAGCRVEGAGQDLVGILLPQPQVLATPDHDMVRLDDVLGLRWSLLGVNVGHNGWPLVVDAALPACVCLDVAMNNRSAALQHDGTTVSDADEALNAVAARLSGRLCWSDWTATSRGFAAGQAPEVARKLGAVGIRPIRSSADVDAVTGASDGQMEGPMKDQIDGPMDDAPDRQVGMDVRADVEGAHR